MSGIVAVDLQRAEKKFADHANMHLQQANDRVHINESILEGFAAMVSTSNSHDRARIRKYAQKMLKQYPHIFMFEIVEKVSHDQLKGFTEYYRRNVYPDFEVKAFSYESDRRWQPVKERALPPAHCVYGAISAGISKGTGAGYQFKRILHASLGEVRATKTLDFD